MASVQEGIGRKYNVVSVASGVALNLRDYGSICFVGTNDNTYTLTLSTTFGGSYSQPSGWNPIDHYYQDTSNGAGTAVWTKQTQSASNAVVIGSDYQVAFELLQSMVPDTYVYVKCTASAPGDGTLMAILQPLVERGPVQLAKVSA